MLAILLVRIEWDKNSRTPSDSMERKEYFKTVRIGDNVNLEGEGIFLKECLYRQSGHDIVSVSEIYEDLNNEEYNKYSEGFSGIDWKKEKRLKILRETMRKEEGLFVREEDIDIPYITIYKKENDIYQIKWFDYGQGMPRRRGGNEDFYKKGKKLESKPNVLNETAFILEQGQSGVLKYNYRYTSWSEQKYVCYYVYMVNDVVLTQDTFIRSYDYEYNQLADLF